ncbi:hypothetical protein GCM10007924_09770 [Sneathiella chinensis]|uniref:Uncharacterized protein n=1 Tax=Sneathiella chinensis TaxID=349750 RepID=A0ABQ5U5J9_9PROT|nr:hypothetical protein GCM10007924_09770 [Sneathiella chinensis]
MLATPLLAEEPSGGIVQFLAQRPILAISFSIPAQISRHLPRCQRTLETTSNKKTDRNNPKFRRTIQKLAEMHHNGKH